MRRDADLQLSPGVFDTAPEIQLSPSSGVPTTPPDVLAGLGFPAQIGQHFHRLVFPGLFGCVASRRLIPPLAVWPVRPRSPRCSAGGLEVGRQRAGDGCGPFGDADRCGGACAMRTLRRPRCWSTQQQANGRLVVAMSEGVVDDGEVHAELAKVVGLEGRCLQFHHDVSTQAQVVQRQVAVEASPPISRCTCRPTNAKPCPSSTRNVPT